MNTTKKILAISSVFIGINSSLFAEGKANHDWAEKAAVGYENKAKAAMEKGNQADAQIYLRMAQIKRDAGAAAKSGEKFSWDEYHKLAGELGKGKKGDHGKKEMAKKEHFKKDHTKKDHKKGKPGAGFLKAAAEYDKKAHEAMENDNQGDASIYVELAKMKRDAAAASAKGEQYNWTRYFELRKRLSKK